MISINFHSQIMPQLLLWIFQTLRQKKRLLNQNTTSLKLPNNKCRWWTNNTKM